MTTIGIVLLSLALGYSFSQIVVKLRTLVETLKFLHGIHDEAGPASELTPLTPLTEEQMARARYLAPLFEAPEVPYPKKHSRPNRRRKAQRQRAERQAARQAAIGPKPWHRHLLDEEEP